MISRSHQEDIDKRREVDNGQKPVSSKRGSQFDFAANKLFWGPSINDPSCDAAASSNELPSQPHPENPQTQAVGAKGLDPVQQEAHQQEMAKEKAKGIRRQRRIEQQLQFFDYYFEQYNDLMNKIPIERGQIYQKRLEEIKAIFPGLFDDNQLQTTSATKHHRPFKLPAESDQRDQAEIGIREVVRQFIELTREVIIREGQLFKKLHADAHKLIQHIHESYTLWMQTHSYFDPTPENYSPYYPMKDVKNEKSINIDSTLPTSSGILAIRWTLSHLGKDIHKDATEQEVAKLADHSEHNGTSMNKMQEAFQFFKIDYSYTREILTIDDIEKVTNCGYPVLTRVYKEGIGVGCVVIEKVSKTENGDHMCTIFDPSDPENQKIRQIPYRELQLVLSDDHLLPTNWQNLSESALETAAIQQQNESIGISEPSSKSVQDIKKKAVEHPAITAIIVDSKKLLAKHQTILQESEQALAGYQQLRSNPQKYEQEQQEIKEKSDLLLKKLHKAQGDTTNLDTNEIEAQIPSITDLQELEEEVAQYKMRYQSITQNDELLSKYQQLQSDSGKYTQEQEAIKTKGDDLLQQLHELERRIRNLPKEEQKIIINDELWKKYVSKDKDKDYTQQEEIRSSYNDIKAKLWNSRTPENEVYIQLDKQFFLLDKHMQYILQESNSILQNIDIDKQKNSNLSTTTHQELIDSADAIKTNIEQLCNSIHASTNNLRKEIAKEFKKFKKQMSENYNPYYSIKDIKYVKSINIASTLPKSSGIRAIRWALSLLGINIHKDATEQKVAKLANHSKKNGTFTDNMQAAFQAFKIDYSSTREILTIDDIEKVTNCGHPVLTRVYKEGIGSNFVVIEKVSRTENGDHMCTIFDPYDPKNQKIREIPYRELQLILSDHHLLPTNWQELADTHEA